MATIVAIVAIVATKRSSLPCSTCKTALNCSYTILCISRRQANIQEGHAAIQEIYMACIQIYRNAAFLEESLYLSTMYEDVQGAGVNKLLLHRNVGKQYFCCKE